jgi:hypothetical protein
VLYHIIYFTDLSIYLSVHPSIDRLITRYSETVELLPRDAIRAVREVAISSTEVEFQGTDVLKPYNLAHLSPRTFWSLVRHYGHDVPAALRLVINIISLSIARSPVDSSNPHPFLNPGTPSDR